MNLLYIGDDHEPSDFNHTFTKKDFGVLQDHSNKLKSNTLHLKSHKPIYPDRHNKI